MRSRWWTAPVVVAAVIGLAACGGSSSSTSSTTPPSGGAVGGSTSSNTINTGSTSVGTILVNSAGHAIYWFAPDTPTTSKCTGSCATYWPPVKGPVTAASGVSLPHGFGTIKRADGSTQATYDGHPLYTYAGDSSAGVATGNGKNLSGGLWWAMTPSGAKPGGAAPSQTSTSSGGYGY